MKRVASSSSLVTMPGAGTLIGFGSTYMKLWNGLLCLCRDPHPEVAILAQREIEYIVNQAIDLIAAKEAGKENYGGGGGGGGSSCSLPPSPNTRPNYLSGGPGGLSAAAAATAVVSDSPPTDLHFRMNGNGTLADVLSKQTATQRAQRAQQPATAPRSRKNSRHQMGGGGGDSTATEVANNGEQPEAASSSSITQLSELQQSLYSNTVATQKPIVTTNFISWAIGRFSAPAVNLLDSHASGTIVDRHSPEYLERIWRFQRNDDVRRLAKGNNLNLLTNVRYTCQHGRVGVTREELPYHSRLSEFENT